jgi:hypothetical protein
MIHCHHFSPPPTADPWWQHTNLRDQKKAIERNFNFFHTMVDSEEDALTSVGAGNGGVTEKTMRMTTRTSSLDDNGSYCFENFPPSDSESASATRDMMLSRRYPQSKAKSLSMKFIKSLSGMCCDNCKKDPFTTAHSNENGEQENNDNHEYDSSVNGELYNLKALQKSLSTISPLVSAPMMLDVSGKEGTTESIIGEYMCFCRFYKVTYNAGILTTLRFSLPCLRVTGSFHDEDMLALVELLLRHGNGALKYISRLDFSIASKEGRHWRNPKLVGFTSHGALALAKALQTTKYIRQVFLQRHRIGPYGSAALFLACRSNPSIEALNLRRCRIGERGAFAFCEIIMGMDPKDRAGQFVTNKSESGLIDVDLSANRIGHQGTIAIEKALERRMAGGSCEPMYVNLEGNLVFPEVSQEFVDAFFLPDLPHLTFLELTDNEWNHARNRSTAQHVWWVSFVGSSSTRELHACHQLWDLHI